MLYLRNNFSERSTWGCESGHRGKQSSLERLSAFIADKAKSLLSHLHRLCQLLRLFQRLGSGQRRSDQLPADATGIRQGLTIMDEEFVTFGTSRVMADDMTYAQAELLSEQIGAITGVKSVESDDSADHFRDGAAPFSITYDGAADPVSAAAVLFTVMRRRKSGQPDPAGSRKSGRKRRRGKMGGAAGRRTQAG